MVKKALEMQSRSFVKSFKTRATAFWEAHLPSRHSLLMSSCNPSEKEARHPPNIAFKPNSFRYANNMAERACHVLGCATRVGLT